MPQVNDQWVLTLSLPKLSSVHASVTNQFNQERSLSSRDLFKANCTAALAEWRALSVN